MRRTLGASTILLAVACSSQRAGPAPATEGCIIPDTGLPADLFCTGLYADREKSALGAGVMPYTPGVVLWSDGAEKHRFLSLPEGATIDTSDLDAWKFPVGTKAWKEFKVDGKLVETRLFWKRSATEWASGTYVWNADGTAATLDTSGPKGTILPNGYEIPTQKDCDKCHHGGSDKLLGVEAVALSLPGAQGATLSVLAGKGALSQPPDVTQRTLPEDATGKAAAALGYLHANCGMPCHSTRGLGEETQLVLRVRAGELWPSPAAVPATDLYRATVSQKGTTASVNQQFPDALRIIPGAHDKSLVWLVAHRRGNYQMPPLVSHVVDEVGTRAIADWIDALPP